MTHDFAAAMLQALAQTRAHNPNAATATLMATLGSRPTPGSDGGQMPPAPTSPSAPMTSPAAMSSDDRQPIAPNIVEGEFQDVTLRAPSTGGMDEMHAQNDREKAPPRRRTPIAEVLRQLREEKSTRPLPGLSLPRMNGKLQGAFGSGIETPEPAIPEGAQFMTHSFTSAQGNRTYKLYRPAHLPTRPRGLVLMLHGCTQNPNDFAKGTAMNALAEEHGLLIVYPAQTANDNASSCWNWFRPGDQRRDDGEPAILAGITRSVAAEFNLARDRIFVAGLSAGGAMAAILGETYPDLFAAVGVHSGLPFRSANDVLSAFAAMRGDGLPAIPQTPHRDGHEKTVRTIVFHGSADHTVHPANADRIVTEATAKIKAGRVSQKEGRTKGGRTYRTITIASADGSPMVEHWMTEGAGHAWSGGHPSGSHTDPTGPDASAEMIRFFLHPTKEGQAR